VSSSNQIDGHVGDRDERASRHTLRLCATLLDSNASAWLEAAIDNVELMERKNRDYGSSFNAGSHAETLYGLAMRMGDKLNRIRRLTKHALLAEVSGEDAGPACSDERLVDALRDLANYALLAQVEAQRE